MTACSQMVLRHQGITLTALIGTILLTGYLYGAAPKSFFPQQDTGLIFGVTEGAQDISIPDLAQKQLRSSASC